MASTPRWIFNDTNNFCFYKDAPKGKRAPRKDGIPAGTALSRGVCTVPPPTVVSWCKHPRSERGV